MPMTHTIGSLGEAFMVSLSNHEGLARSEVNTASWFDRLAMKLSRLPAGLD